MRIRGVFIWKGASNDMRVSQKRRLSERTISVTVTLYSLQIRQTLLYINIQSLDTDFEIHNPERTEWPFYFKWFCAFKV